MSGPKDGEVTPFKPPAWLTAKVDQRLALMEEAIGDVVDESVEMFHALTGFKPSADVDMIAKMMQGNIMMTPLSEPDEGSSVEEIRRWERSCDNCETFVPDGELFFTGQLVREFHGQQVILVFGVCPACKDAP